MTRKLYLLLLSLAPAAYPQCYQFVASSKTLTINIATLPQASTISAGPLLTQSYSLLSLPGNSMTLTIGGTTYTADLQSSLVVVLGSSSQPTTFFTAIGATKGLTFGVGLEANGSLLPRDTLPATLPPLSAWNYSDHSAQLTTTPDPIGAVTHQDYFEVTSMGPCPPSVLNQPSIQASQGIVNGASFQENFASSTWLTIRGTQLSTTTRAWQSSDFIGNSLPTSLDGVQVIINGKPSYVYYISPTQLNVLTPDDPTTGPVPVQVITKNGASTIVTVTKSSVAPAFFAYSQQTGRYVIAQDASTYALLAPIGLLGSAVATRPAIPGETISFYATGLGPTTPSYPTGQIIPAPAPLSNPIQVMIGGTSANATFAGIVGSGLYQINVVVPNLPTGDASVVFQIGTTQFPANTYIPILNSGPPPPALGHVYAFSGKETDDDLAALPGLPPNKVEGITFVGKFVLIPADGLDPELNNLCSTGKDASNAWSARIFFDRENEPFTEIFSDGSSVTLPADQTDLFVDGVARGICGLNADGSRTPVGPSSFISSAASGYIYIAFNDAPPALPALTAPFSGVIPPAATFKQADFFVNSLFDAKGRRFLPSFKGHITCLAPLADPSADPNQSACGADAKPIPAAALTSGIQPK